MFSVRPHGDICYPGTERRIASGWRACGWEVNWQHLLSGSTSAQLPPWHLEPPVCLWAPSGVEEEHTAAISARGDVVRRAGRLCQA
ncbi:hypothetical protein SKAU_G00070460 [Synaphobranchus kaupii]|uniref:Uncharacterized protein n=1 Tax=Synaphobranchus kaupii TaxID=118154 RepID=A0A9Q1G739_SYNKA|nr:hypothetical protein SKAU_G00070460 [Synaphobranchus kaupii]